jgi:hypothetical protein
VSRLASNRKARELAYVQKPLTYARSNSYVKIFLSQISGVVGWPI